MSVAKRDRGKDKPPPPNEDEGKLIEQNEHQRFARTNQALKWAKGGIADAKLYIYAKTGQIEESDDSNDVTEAFQKLDTYREQIDSLLYHAENWTKTMLQTWNYQTNLIDALNECHTVINTFHSRHNSPLNEQQKIDKIDEHEINNNNNNNNNASFLSSDKNEFAEIMKGISNELYLDQTESKKRYGHASKLLVVPLRNILNHEIMHACEMKRRYVNHKRQFDNCCTTITHIRNKIEEIENPKLVENNAENTAVTGTFGKLKLGFNKLIQSNPTKDELQHKLQAARAELPQYIKVFENAKQQMLEAVNIVEQKLNVEVVYYVQQFYTFVQKWKSGNMSNSNNLNDGYSGDNDMLDEAKMNKNKGKNNNVQNINENEMNDHVVDDVDDVNDINIKDTEDNIVVQEIQQNNNDMDSNKEDKFVSDLQIDAMINNPDMDEVNLDDMDNIADNVNDNMDNNNNDMSNDVDSNNSNIDAGYDNENENENDIIDQIEISENHDVDT